MVSADRLTPVDNVIAGALAHLRVGGQASECEEEGERELHYGYVMMFCGECFVLQTSCR